MPDNEQGSLEAIMTGDKVEVPPALDGPAEITLEQAMRSYRRIVFLEDQEATEKAYVDAEIARLQGWLAERQKACEGKVQWHKQVLYSFFTLFHRRNPKDKSYKLPGGGLVGQKKTADQIVKAQEDEDLIATLEQKGLITANPFLTKTETKLQWAVLKDQLFVMKNADGTDMLDDLGLPMIGYRHHDGSVEGMEGVRLQRGEEKLYLKLGTGLAELPPGDIPDDEPEE